MPASSAGLYGESKEAFASGDGELAKTLSLEGRATQEECESLNAQMNRMRAELRAVHDRIDGIFRELRDSRTRIAMLEAALQTMRRPRIHGFDRSNISWIEIECFLDGLPQLALREIEHIEFLPECPEGKTGGGKLGDTRWDPETKRAFIRVYRHEHDDRGHEHETIAHEVAHEIFLKYLAPMEKGVWEELYLDSGDRFISTRAIRSFEEDFCECFRAFFSRQEELAERNSRKYTFIKGVVKRLEVQS